jgi:hypothetical protein
MDFLKKRLILKLAAFHDTQKAEMKMLVGVRKLIIQ